MAFFWDTIVAVMNYMQQWCFFCTIFLIFDDFKYSWTKPGKGINLPSIVGEGNAHFFYAYYRSSVRAKAVQGSISYLLIR